MRSIATPRKRLLLGSLAVSMLVLTACGSSGSESATDSAPEEAAAASEAPSAAAESAAPASAEAAVGECPENDARIAELDAALAENLYVQAFEQSGKEMVTNPNPIPEGETIKVFFSLEGLSHPFLVAQQDLAEGKAKELGVEVDVVSANDDVNKQFNDIQAGIAGGASAIMMMPANTEGLSEVLGQAEQQGIPYAFTQKGMLGVNPITQVLAPYAAEGKAVGEWVVNHFADEPGPIKVALIEGITGDVSSVARTGSFERELLKACKFEIVASQPGQYRRDASQEAMDSIIAANPEIDLVFGANDEGALGALAALEAAGLTDVGVVGIDGQTTMFDAIKDGKVLVTMKHNPTAPFALENVVEYLRGEPVPTFEVNPGEIVDATNVNDLEPAF
jgi:ABC-type sugar transport system substrate-binding protein